MAFVESPSVIAAVLVHVADVAAGLTWYERALLGTRHRVVAEYGAFEFLELGGVRLEMVPADSKVASGPAGSVVYWCVQDLGAALRHLQACGATLYRGPLKIEGEQEMCQVLDPWGNCIGLRGRSEIAASVQHMDLDHSLPRPANGAPPLSTASREP